MVSNRDFTGIEKTIGQKWPRDRKPELHFGHSLSPSKADHQGCTLTPLSTREGGRPDLNCNNSYYLLNTLMSQVLCLRAGDLTVAIVMATTY